MAVTRPKRIVKLEDVEILEKRYITEDLFLMWIEKPDGYTFKPGQYCTIGSGNIERAYSIVSAPHESTLELFVEVVPLPEGALTPLLDKLEVGDKVTIRPRAKGVFVFKPKVPNQLLISTVTGVVPYLSFIRDYLHRRDSGHRFFALQGASYSDEFTYDVEILGIEESHPGLVTYVPTISRPNEERNAGWEGETGRVNTIVERYVAKWGLTPSDTIVYACGHPGMIEDIKQRMSRAGFSVVEERFWKE